VHFSVDFAGLESPAHKAEVPTASEWVGRVALNAAERQTLVQAKLTPS
jgi:hypothetical protein